MDRGAVIGGSFGPPHPSTEFKFTKNIMPDTYYFMEWDKVGIVGILVAVVLLHLIVGKWLIRKAEGILKSVQGWASEISRVHIEATEKHTERIVDQTNKVSQLTDKIQEQSDQTYQLHQRIDRTLMCRKTDCPVKQPT